MSKLYAKCKVVILCISFICIDVSITLRDALFNDNVSYLFSIAYLTLHCAYWFVQFTAFNTAHFTLLHIFNPTKTLYRVSNHFVVTLHCAWPTQL